MHATECVFHSGAGVPDPQAHGGGLVLCAHDNIGVTVEGKVVVGQPRSLDKVCKVSRGRSRSSMSTLHIRGSGARAG